MHQLSASAGVQGSGRGRPGLEEYGGEGKALPLCGGSGAALQERCLGSWLTVVVPLGPDSGQRLFGGSNTPHSKATGANEDLLLKK